MPELQDKPPLCSTYDRVPKEDAIQQHIERGRFGGREPEV